MKLVFNLVFTERVVLRLFRIDHVYRQEYKKSIDLTLPSVTVNLPAGLQLKASDFQQVGTPNGPTELIDLALDFEGFEIWAETFDVNQPKDVPLNLEPIPGVHIVGSIGVDV